MKTEIIKTSAADILLANNKDAADLRIRAFFDECENYEDICRIVPSWYLNEHIPPEKDMSCRLVKGWYKDGKGGFSPIGGRLRAKLLWEWGNSHRRRICHSEIDKATKRIAERIKEIGCNDVSAPTVYEFVRSHFIRIASENNWFREGI